MSVVVTFGTFDLFHFGHLELLRRCKQFGDRLIVGVSSDDFSFQKKNRKPIFPLVERMAILQACRYVDDVFIEESMQKKREYLHEHRATVLIMGSDWQGAFDEFNDICKVIYLSRTPDVSTSELIERIKASESFTDKSNPQGSI